MRIVPILVFQIYFTTNVRKIGNVCVCPFNVVVSEMKYVPAGVACPVGLFAKLAHDPAPTAINMSIAKVRAIRR